ncbi:putative tRNA 2'-phosphotransferase [Leucosporidium creatinivorum]|uniref:2'-phosphotransferase n=1 Tax=Leucosporidium creatinivorum TaxID=106004 RepID=A0A1Y2G3Q2_9BASI|nr:putative tRNA 2'-phosphotransferase [Leucosporidium creatinivorum]
MAEESSAPVASSSTAPPAAAAAKPARSARGRPADDPDTRHSKTLSYILRHGAAKESLVLRPDGFVRVEELMKRPKLKGCDMETLHRIVRDNAKQRFTIRSEPTGDGGAEELWIRANQGHSVVESLELKEVASAEEVPVMVHGTTYALWPVISKEGLKKMTRNHIHCAVGLSGDKAVTSGMRTTANLFIYLDVAAMLADSIKIYTSTNNVLLTSGVDGALPPKYFKQVVHKVKGGELEEVPLGSTEA